MTNAATGDEIQHIFDMAVDAAAWCKAYADAPGIAYGRACRLVMEPIGCRRHVIK